MKAVVLAQAYYCDVSGYFPGTVRDRIGAEYILTPVTIKITDTIVAIGKNL